MRTAKTQPTPCPECSAREVRGSVLHRPTCSKRTGRLLVEMHPKLPPIPITPELIAAPEIHILDADGLCKNCGRTFTLVLSPPIASPPAELGRKGGQSRASHLTPEQRSEAARKAAKARWGKRG